MEASIENDEINKNGEKLSSLMRDPNFVENEFREFTINPDKARLKYGSRRSYYGFFKILSELKEYSNEKFRETPREMIEGSIEGCGDGSNNGISLMRAFINQNPGFMPSDPDAINKLGISLESIRFTSQVFSEINSYLNRTDGPPVIDYSINLSK